MRNCEFSTFFQIPNFPHFRVTLPRYAPGSRLPAPHITLELIYGFLFLFPAYDFAQEQEKREIVNLWPHDPSKEFLTEWIFK